MMKKLATLLAAAAFMAVTAGNALAYFEDLSLVRVVYDSSSATGKEIAYDLGNINTYLAGGSFTTDAITTDFNGVALSNLRVAYYAYDSSTSSIWLSAGDTTPSVYASAFSNVQGAAIMGALNPYMSNVNGKAETTANDPNSYVALFNAEGNQPGTMAGAFGSNIGETSLANLASGVTQKLYFFADADNGATGELVLNFTTTDTGTTMTSAAPVPIPPSFLLMGSGLLGMVGIRRKFVA